MAEKTTSDEVNKRQLELARKEGEAYYDSVEYMINEAAHIGGTREVRDMILGFAQEKAEGLYVVNAENDLKWTEPQEENCHIEVTVMDADDKRFLPYCDIQVTFIEQDDTEHGPYDIPFVWHPGMFHYGRNIELPGDGVYDIRVHVNRPTFERHDKENGDRYTHPVEVIFENVDIKTGQG